MTTKKRSVKTVQTQAAPKDAVAQKKADKTVASGKMALAKADRKAASAQKKAVHTQIAKEKGYTHGVTVGFWNLRGSGGKAKVSRSSDESCRGKGKCQ